ncbi:MAG: DUF883 domain-containing protein [Gammaproteobacteria bacterium]|nr:DUF883 domain-containing protein [Gammaproteobacteria bacterium]
MTAAVTEGSDPLGTHNGGGEIGNLREASRQARAAVRDEVQKLIADVEGLIRRVGDAADPELRRLRAEVQNAIAATRQALAERAEQVQQRAEEVFEASDSYVRAQPWQTIGMVAVAGLLLGLLIGRR